MQQGSINKGNWNEKVHVLHSRTPSRRDNEYNVYSE